MSLMTIEYKKNLLKSFQFWPFLDNYQDKEKPVK